jgi:hypothetical protein
VLDLRPNCECCNKDLLPAATDAMICSFECTFCRDCAETTLGGRCPNCGGGLVARPKYISMSSSETFSGRSIGGRREGRGP